MRFISRADRCWRVWVQYGKFNSGQLYFGDAKFGGRQNALVAAKFHRDRLVRENGIPMRTYTGNGYCVTSKRNTSGTVGITLAKTDSGPTLRVFWSSRSMVDGHQTQTARSIRKFGYIRAWQLVAAVRAKHTGLQIPAIPPAPPEWLKKWAAAEGVALPPDEFFERQQNGEPASAELPVLVTTP